VHKLARKGDLAGFITFHDIIRWQQYPEMGRADTRSQPDKGDNQKKIKSGFLEKRFHWQYPLGRSELK